ncbi:MAG: 6-phosphofructokinase, partial [Candidatus Anstonellaceae archaeon]
YFFLIGGDSTALIAKKIFDAAIQLNYELSVFLILKTIDNDVSGTDHTCGYGSAARLIAKASYGIDQENRSSGGIYGMVVMGRDAGFLACASTLLRDSFSGPDLVYIPEINFNLDYFINDIRDVYSRKKRAFFVISEGIRTNIYENGKLVYDEFGKPKNELILDIACKKLHKEVEKEEILGTSSLSAGTDILISFLHSILTKEFKGIRLRFINLGYLARSFPEISLIDAIEAEAVGKAAVDYAFKNGPISGAVGIERIGQGQTYTIKLNFIELEKISSKTKQVPAEWIGYYGKDISSEFLNYAGPLVGFIDGFEHLDHLLPSSFDFNEIIKK